MSNTLKDDQFYAQVKIMRGTTVLEVATVILPNEYQRDYGPIGGIALNKYEVLAGWEFKPHIVNRDLLVTG